MGYCVTATCDVLIPGDRVEEAIKAIRQLMLSVSENGSGGQFGGGVKTESWYSWVGTAEVLRALANNDLVKALEEWRYEAEAGEKADLEKLATPDRSVFGDVRVNYFSGEKLGDDEKLWKALAPFVKSGSTIEWHGEDDAHWRYLFENGELTAQHGMVVWGQ